MTEARDVTRPAATAELAASLAHRLYGLTGEAQPLPSERDRNFLIDGDPPHVLKVFHADATEASVHMQAACAAHVAARLDELVVPKTVATQQGSAFGTVDLAGHRHLVRLVAYVPGRTLSSLRPKSIENLRRLGRAAGSLVGALADFDHPAVAADFSWDLRHAAGRIRRMAPGLPAERRARLVPLVDRAAHALDQLEDSLPIAVIHGDLNDHNVIVGEQLGVIDFGDVHRSYRIAEVAIAAAYAAFGFVDPVDAIAAVTSGSADMLPWDDTELAAVVPLAVLRLGLSVVMASRQTVADPANDYLTISQHGAWETLLRLDAVPLRLATARVRAACGRQPVPESVAVTAWLAHHRDELAGVLELPLTAQSTCVLDWSVTSPEVAHPVVAPPLDEQIRRTEEIMRRSGADVAVGRYGEPRLVYAAPEYAVATNYGPAARTVHLGVDLSCPPGTEVRALHAGTVARVDHEMIDGGYGPVVTLRHAPPAAPAFFTLYGHLDAASLDGLRPGRAVATGDRIGAVGRPPDNGNWPPHLHFQIICDDLDGDGPFPGVALPDRWEVWSALSPSPATALGLPAAMIEAPHPDDAAVERQRRRLVPPSLSTSYDLPLVAVRGFGAYLYDGWGRRHLDCVNNVAHVGHEHPAVVAALTRQARLLNTNSRYPHPERVRYLERLLALFPESLDTTFLVCTGSEANDLALRIATTVTGRRNVTVLEGAYHGHTAALIDASPYKHDGPGGGGRPPHIHVVPLPDPYRRPDAVGLDGLHTALGAATGAGGVAALLVEPMPSVAGQIELPPGWLRDAFAAVRRAGGVAIADEVQVGLGRTGSHWWAFERDDALPDIVTVGKPIGNGHPLAAVVTRREIAAEFANGMEYFNTFGGNPVSCAVGNAVLDVMEAEGLRHRAAEVGAQLVSILIELADRFPLIGDVRGAGMFLGVELVTDRETRHPAAAQAKAIVERARRCGVLLSVDGLHRNVLKIKPPLAFAAADAERVGSLLADLLAEDAAQPRPP